MHANRSGLPARKGCLADSRELSLQVRRSASPYYSESHAMEDVALDRPLDPRVGGRTTRIHTNGHRGPAPPGARSRSEPTAVRSGIGLGRLSLHTAGPDNPDRATRLHLLGTSAIGSVPGRHRRSGAGQSGMEWVEGGDCSRPSLDGPGPRCGVIGKYRYSRSHPTSITRWDFIPFHVSPFIREK